MDAIKTAKVWIGERKGITSPIHVSQYDTGWTFLLTVYKDDVVYTSENAVTVVMEGLKADGTTFAVPGTFEDGVATIVSTVAMTAAAGIVECELRLSEGEETIGTGNFDIVVEASPIEGGTPSESDYTAMQTLLDDVAELHADTVEQAAAAEAAASTAAQEVASEVPEMVADWLEGNVSPETGYVIDNSLSVANAAADAKAVGDVVAPLEKSAYSENVFGSIEKTITNKRYINQATGEIGSTSNTKLNVVSITNNGYRYIKVKSYLADANTAAIAFYSTDSISTDGFISRVRGASGTNTYIAEVPSNCRVIGFTENTTNGDMEIYLMTGDLFLASYEDIKQIPRLIEATQEVPTSNIMPHIPYTNKKYISYSTGELGDTANTNLGVYTLKNDDYIRAYAKLYLGDANSAAIAFYSTDGISTEGFISSASVRGSSGWHEYSALVPDNCVTIAFTYNGSDAGQTPYIKCSIRNEYNPYQDYTNSVKPHAKVYSTNHRGWHNCPEDTLTAYRQSATHGFPQVETDVRFTADNIPVLLHDSTINRTARNADGTTIAEAVAISSLTYEEALEYDFGIYKGNQYAGEKIPTLKQFLKLCRDIGVIPYIELEGTATVEKAQIIADVVNASGIRNDVVFISNYMDWLQMLLPYFPANRFGVSPWTYSDSHRTAAISLFNGRAEIFMHMSVSQVTNEIIQALAEDNIPLELWITDAAAIRAADDYVSGFTSNDAVASEVLYNAEIPSN